MESEKRPYQLVRVEMIGVEHGLERFLKDGITTLPPMAKWRNNLTALSQRENLFFIASDGCVAVYQPEFPYQALRRQPALLIKPELANQHALGYLSSHRDGIQDHCINHLMVGDLGTQEILLFATDSGNVEAYYTASILEAIKRAPGQYCEGSSSDVLGLWPFFSQWVRQSAWGIDIHKEARMIAVSANVPNRSQPGNDEDSSATISVFAFALIAPPSSENGSSDEGLESPDASEVEWSNWNPRTHSGLPTRDRNYKIVLAGWDGHDNNIPNISFVNTPDDEGGTWLLSTDITGEMKLWQIWKGSNFRTWNFGISENSVRPWMNHQYPGWSVAAIDINSFRPAKTNEEFIGSHKVPPYHGFHDQGQSFDLSPTVRRLPDHSQLHPSHSDLTDIDPPSDGDQVHNDDGEAENEDEDELDKATTMEDIHSPANTTNPMPQVPAQEHFQDDYAREQDLWSFNRPTEFEIETDDESSRDEDDSSVDEDESMEEDEPLPLPPNDRTQRHIRRLVTPIQNPNIKTPDIAMVHCSDSHIRLLGSPKARFPHIFCANMLRQLMPHNVHASMQGLEFAHMDRLNMIQKVPELGIVLIGTQTGRVAVCALTKRPDLLLGLRIDWVLPTKKQERSGRRPEMCTLVGMAVGPIQGRWQSQSRSDTDNDDEAVNFDDREIDGVRTSFDPKMTVLRHQATLQERQAWRGDRGTSPPFTVEHRPWKKPPKETPPWQAMESTRRYRVMLTYSDMSVLTYEIWRDTEESEHA